MLLLIAGAQGSQPLLGARRWLARPAAGAAAAAARPLAAPAAAAPSQQRQPTPQIYGFHVDGDAAAFAAYDWDLLTHVGWVDDPSLAAAARQTGAKVELQALRGLEDVLPDPEKRRQWIGQQLARAREVGANGINFDLETPIKPGAQAAADYTALVAEAAAAFRAALGPDASISVDIPWSPYDIDGRNYDWAGLAEAADLLFIMAYDTQSQITGTCVASANAPLDAVRRGVAQWLGLGLPPQKLVLGLPWYGYDYPCQHNPHTGAPAGPDPSVCRLAPAPFRGVSCSDAAGVQRCYKDIRKMLRPGGAAANATVHRDPTQGAPYYSYRGADGTTHQVWFDDPESLLPKYRIAADAGLAGVGFWNLDCLAHGSPDEQEQRDTAAMWEAVRAAFSGPPSAAAGEAAVV